MLKILLDYLQLESKGDSPVCSEASVACIGSGKITLLHTKVFLLAIIVYPQSFLKPLLHKTFGSGILSLVYRDPIMI